MARSAGTAGWGAAASRLARMAKPAASASCAGAGLASDCLHLDSLDAGLGRMAVAQGVEKLVQCGRRSFGLDLHRAGVVLHPAGQAAATGGIVNERAKADPLDHAADGDRPSVAGNGFGRRRLHRGDGPRRGPFRLWVSNLSVSDRSGWVKGLAQTGRRRDQPGLAVP